MKDRSSGWCGLFLGTFFGAISFPGLMAWFTGGSPSVTIRSIHFSGTDALAISVIAALAGAIMFGAGLWRLVSGRA